MIIWERFQGWVVIPEKKKVRLLTCSIITDEIVIFKCLSVLKSSSYNVTNVTEISSASADISRLNKKTKQTNKQKKKTKNTRPKNAFAVSPLAVVLFGFSVIIGV